MIAWFVAGGICLVLVVAAAWEVVRLLALGSESDSGDADASAAAAEFEETDDDSADWSWRSTADVS